ncbi:MAG: STAS domain-containing protein, partial [Thermodesulfobacteriota bacterium]
MKDHDAEFSSTSVEAFNDPDGTLVLTIKGRLDVYSTGNIWKDSTNALEKSTPRKLVIDAEGIEYCDASGIALLIELKLIQEKKGRGFELRGLSEDNVRLYRLFNFDLLSKPEGAGKPPSRNIVERVG